MAYLFVMNAGRPDWSNLYGEDNPEAGFPGPGAEAPLERPNPFVHTVPVAPAPERERASVGAF